MVKITTVRLRRAMRLRLPSHQPISFAGRVVSLLLGGFFASLTLRTLLWEVSSLRDLTPENYLTVGAIVGAVASGVFFWAKLRQGRLLTATGLAIAFTAATGYCLIGSAGRNDERSYAANAEARHTNEVRETLARDVREAHARYETALQAEEAECATGAGIKCKAKRDTTQLRRADLENAEKAQRSGPTAQRENGKLEKAAELIAFFSDHDQKVVERGLALLWPFIPPMVCELLTIVFLHQGFHFGARHEETVAADTATVSGSETEPPPGSRAPAVHEPMNRELMNRSGTVHAGGNVVSLPARGERFTKAQALADLQAYVAKHGEVPSQKFCKARWRLSSKGTVSNWCKEWERAGLISRRSAGRCKAVASA